MQVAPTIHNQEYKNTVPDDPINDAVWFEEDLSEIPDAKIQQFTGVNASFRVFGEANQYFFDPLENEVGFPWHIVTIDVVVKFVQVSPPRQRPPGHAQDEDEIQGEDDQ